MQSAGVSVPSVILVDSFGRPSKQQQRESPAEPPTTASAGYQLRHHTAHYYGDCSTDGSTCNTLYDLFDRVQTIQQPDENKVTIVLHGQSRYHDGRGGTTSIKTPTMLSATCSGHRTGQSRRTRLGNGLPVRWHDRWLKRVDQKGGSTSPSNWRTRTFAYDSLGRVTDQTTPEAGQLTFNNYDLNGNLLMQTDARGLTVQYQYDALNRLTHKILQNGSTYVYNYDTQDSSGDPFGSGAPHVRAERDKRRRLLYPRPQRQRSFRKVLPAEQLCCTPKAV